MDGGNFQINIKGIEIFSQFVNYYYQIAVVYIYDNLKW